jgi:hypothetical protein
MPSAERRAKIPPDLVVAKPLAPLGETLLCRKGTANAVGFRPQDWSYDDNSEPTPSAVTPLAHPVTAPSSPQDTPATGVEVLRPPPSADADDPPQAHLAAKQALAADLAGMIEGMLRTTQFATAATSRARQTIGARAEDADAAITGSSLTAELARARPAPVIAPVKPRRRWIDAALALACLIMVLSAGYFAFTF